MPDGTTPIATGTPAPAEPLEAPRSRPRLAPGAARGLARAGLIVTSVGLMLALWAWGSTYWSDTILPAPATVWDTFLDQVERGVWGENVLATLRHVFTAFGLILAIGLPLGLLVGRSSVLEDLLRVPLLFLQMVPIVVFIALALIFIGTTSTGVVAVTVAAGLTYFTLNVVQGSRAVDHTLIEMARAYGAREPTIIRTVVLPSVIPYFLAGARIVLGVAWHVTLFGEFLMGTPGVGFQISGDIKLLDTPAVFSWGLTIVALTVVFEYGVFRPVERLLTRHTRMG